jgi:hypothetical protein
MPTAPEGTPRAMPWDEYEDALGADWSNVLESATSERDIQQFLERHPSLLPGAHALGGLIGHHGPYPSALVTQPPLHGVGHRTPDFMWLTRDSAFLAPVLIEIEDPRKRWLTRGGRPHHDLVQALDQFREWREWFNRPANQQLFLDYYRVPLQIRDRRFFPLFILVYGRRGENPQGIGKLRAEYRSEDRYLMTFDQLRPDETASSFLCVTNTRGFYEAKYIPPTVLLGPRVAHDFAEIAGKEEAARRSALPEERREFLIRRFSHWDHLAREHARDPAAPVEGWGLFTSAPSFE